MSISGSNSQRIDDFFENINAWSGTKRMLVCVGVILLIAAVFYYFSFRPRQQTISQLGDQLKNSENRLAVLKGKADQLDKFTKELAEAERTFKLAMQALPDKKEIPSLLTSVSQSGHDAGLEFLLFEPKPEQLKNFYAEIPVQMELKGGYHDVGHFFEAVAGLPRIVNIRDITMAPKKAGEPLVTSCKAVTYKFVETSAEKTGKTKKKK